MATDTTDPSVRNFELLISSLLDDPRVAVVRAAMDAEEEVPCLICGCPHLTSESPDGETCLACRADEMED